MKASEALLKSFTSLPKPSCSRIPHLRIHILQKDAKAGRGKTLGSNSLNRASSTKSGSRDAQDSRRLSFARSKTSSTSRFPLCRSNASLAYSSEFSYKELDSNLRETHEAIFSTSVQKEATEQDKNVPANFHDILRDGNPERLLFAFVNPSIGPIFIKQADNVAFEQAFRALDPSYFIEPYKPLYRYMKQDLQVMPRFRLVRSFQDRVERIAEVLDDIITQRRNACGGLTIDVYGHLLKWAKSFGDGNMARHVFHYMMPQDGVKPDLESYNNFLGAINWSHAYSAEGQFRLRVTPRNLRLRGEGQRPEDLSGHRVGKEGLRSEALETFRLLVTQGLRGDEVTHTSLMISLGREGDLPGVKSILKSVWNVDVDMLDMYDEEEIESPTFYEPGSPLQPTWRLLSAIVHAFGYNNEVGLAFSLLDYVSRNCNIEVPESVWADLYDRAFVLSLHRSKNQRKQRQNIGQIDKTVFDRMFRLMTDEPYQIQPTFDMFALRSRSQRDWGMLTGAIEAFRGAKRLLDEDRTKLSICYDEVLSFLPKPTQAKEWDGFLSAPFFEARRKFILASLKVDYELQLLVILMRNILKEREWPGSGKLTEWAHRGLPALIGEFQEFLPNSIRYQIPSGIVELEGKAHRTQANRQANDTQTRKAGIMRGALDTEDYEQLMHNIASLPQMLKYRDTYCPICKTSDHSSVDCLKNLTMWMAPSKDLLPATVPYRSAAVKHQYEVRIPRKRFGFQRR